MTYSSLKESIHIRNLGPIKDIEIDDIRPFTVFVGKSGSGKSTVIKTIALFRWILKMVSIRSFLKLSGVTNSPFTFDFNQYLKNNGIDGFVKDDTEISYSFGDCHIHYALKSGLTADDIKNWEGLTLEKISFISDKRNMIPEILTRNIPRNLFNFFLQESLDDYLKATEYVKDLDIESLDVKFKVVKESNGVAYKIDGDDEGTHYSINLKDASSGTQTVTPLSVIVEYFSHHYDIVGTMNKAIVNYLSIGDNLASFKAQTNVGDLNSKRVNLHIEEPELSLYPESQCMLIDFITDRCFNDTGRGYVMTVMLATHSPYIVNHLNLLAARADRDIHGVPSLKLEDMDVYEILDGYLSDLKQPEARLIDTRLLSDPIADIYNEYNSLTNHD